MSKDITIASTTDTQEQVNLAAGLPAGAKPAEAGAGTGKVEVPAVEVESKPVEESPKLAEEEKPKEEEGKEAKAAEGKTAEELAAEEGKDKDKGKGGFQKRIDKLTRRNYALEAQLEEQGRRVEELLARLEDKAAAAPAGAGAEAAPAVDAGKPMPEQFEGKPYEDYIEALSAWKASQLIKAALDKQTAEAAKQTEERRSKEAFDAYNERVTAAHEKYGDFDEVVGREDVRIPQAVQLVTIELENGPDVAYYLGQHPEVCQELCVLTPLAAVARVGMIAATLAAEEAEKKGDAPGGSVGAGEKPRVSSAAPPPIKPVGGASTKSAVPLDQLPYPEYRRAREQQEKSRTQ